MENCTYSLLVVDDDPLIHQSLRLMLPAQWKLYSAMTLQDIPERSHFHAAFVDMHLTNNIKSPEGLTALKLLQTRFATCELIGMSGDLSRSLMESAITAGADKFLSKPLSAAEIHLILAKVEALWNLKNQLSFGSSFQTRWIGQGKKSTQLLHQIALSKSESFPILIEGESGVGKEVVAKILHEQENKSRPWIAINVAALPENLFESELFGHVKGAFTGADRDKVGLIELAHGGDLFLDEIEALPLPLQVKLLRFLESGEIRRVGGKDSFVVKTRIIAASNKPLDILVKENFFREDLYFRLRGHFLQIAPLRERTDDLHELTKFFLEKQRPKRNKEISEEALSVLISYSWPGNVRELRQTLEQVCLSSPLPIIRDSDVLKHLPKPQSMTGAFDLANGLDALTIIFEKQIIQRALTDCKGDVEKSSQLLKISRSNLYKKIKDYQLENTNT
jgi:DNA-binding NtrC family response regulator